MARDNDHKMLRKGIEIELKDTLATVKKATPAMLLKFRPLVEGLSGKLNSIIYEQRVKDDALFEAIESGDAKGVLDAVDNGADVDARNHEGKMPLTIACKGNHTKIAFYLIERVMEIDAKDDDGMTAFAYAASNGNIKILGYLYGKGAKLNIRDKNKNTPLMHASRNGHIRAVELLLRARDSRVMISVRNQDEDTALILAAENGHTRITELLLEAGARNDLANLF